MISQNDHAPVYLAGGVTDLRKSIDGLAVLVKEAFKLDPFSTRLEKKPIPPSLNRP